MFLMFRQEIYKKDLNHLFAKIYYNAFPLIKNDQSIINTLVVTLWLKICSHLFFCLRADFVAKKVIELIQLFHSCKLTKNPANN